MKTNDLKKGDRVQLRNGWYATIADNAKGNTRIATVEGHVTETGSVYSHDIVSVIEIAAPRSGVEGEGHSIRTILHTPAQDKLRATIMRMGL